MIYRVEYSPHPPRWQIIEIDPPSVHKFYLAEAVDPFLANDIAKLLADDRDGTCEPIPGDKLTQVPE